jgi:hypothetical protein
MQTKGVEVPEPTIYCKLFEAVAGATYLVEAPKMHPRTRHINHEYHRFREWVKPGLLANPVCLGSLSETSESNPGLIVATVIYSTRECWIIQSIWIWYCVEDNDELHSVR